MKWNRFAKILIISMHCYQFAMQNYLINVYSICVCTRNWDIGHTTYIIIFVFNFKLHISIIWYLPVVSTIWQHNDGEVEPECLHQVQSQGPQIAFPSSYICFQLNDNLAFPCGVANVLCVSLVLQTVKHKRRIQCYYE